MRKVFCKPVPAEVKRKYYYYRKKYLLSDADAFEEALREELGRSVDPDSDLGKAWYSVTGLREYLPSAFI